MSYIYTFKLIFFKTKQDYLFFLQEKVMDLTYRKGVVAFLLARWLVIR